MLAKLGTQAVVATYVGCTGTLVGFWMRGERVPAPHWRLILEQIYSIPPGAWDLPAPSAFSPAPSIRKRLALALAKWPEARERADEILRQAGIT
jgi:hypothetical protein